jgi:hypothetical protein
MAYCDTESGRRARAKIRAGEGFLYVAEVVGTGIVKIGFSLDPESRIKTVSPFTQEPVRLMGFFPCSLLLEKKLHRLLRPHTSAKHGNEFYPRSILTHEAIPEGLRSETA